MNFNIFPLKFPFFFKRRIGDPFVSISLLNDLGVWVFTPFESVRVTETDDSPITEISFTVAGIERSGTVWNLLTLNRQVDVTFIIGGEQYSYRCRIIARPKRLEAPLSDMFEVLCYDQAYEATRTVFIDSWPKPEITTWSEIVLDAWELYGPEGVTLDGIDVNEEEPAEVLCPLESLYDMMSQVCDRSGWRWKIEEGDLKFFDPVANEDELELTEDNIKPGSTLGEDFPEVANVVKIPAFYRIEDFEDIQTTTLNLAFYPTQYRPKRGFGAVEEFYKPAIYLDDVEIPQADIVEDGKLGYEDAVIIYNIENRFVRFNSEEIPNPISELKIIYDAEIPILVTRENEASIVIYGRIEHPLKFFPRPSHTSAVEIADSYLATHAIPVTGFEADLLGVSDIRAASMVSVVLEDHGIDQLMPVTAVTRSWNRSEGFRIHASFQRAAVADTDAIIDLFRRIKRLESRDVRQDESISRSLEVDDEWSWSEEVKFGWSDVIWPSDTRELKHLRGHFGDEGGLLIYPC